MRHLRRTLVKPKATAPPRQTVDDNMIKAHIRDFKAGAYKNLKDGRIRINDSEQPGLQIIIYKDGWVTFHAGYALPNGSRPVFKIGEWSGSGAKQQESVGMMTLPEAREVTRVIRAKAAEGFDVQSLIWAAHEKLINDIKAKGDKWRP